MSVTYREGSETRTQPVLPGLGAYLIVQRYSSGRPLGSVSESDGRDEPGNYSSPAAPNGALTAITYSYAGRSCVDRGNLRLASCGLSEVPPPRPAALPIVHEPLHAHLQIHNHVITSAQISFHAPYPVTNADESYSVSAPVCHRGLAGASSRADVARGALVTIPVGLRSLLGVRPGGDVHRRIRLASRAACHNPRPSAASRSTSRPAHTPHHYRGRLLNRKDGLTRHAACTRRFISRSCPSPAQRATPRSCSTRATRARSPSRPPMPSLLRPPATPGPPNTPSTGSPHARPAAAPGKAGAYTATSERTNHSEPPRSGSSCSHPPARRARASKSLT